MPNFHSKPVKESRMKSQENHNRYSQTFPLTKYIFLKFRKKRYNGICSLYRYRPRLSWIIQLLVIEDRLHITGLSDTEVIIKNKTQVLLLKNSLLSGKKAWTQTIKRDFPILLFMLVLPDSLILESIHPFPEL